MGWGQLPYFAGVHVVCFVAFHLCHAPTAHSALPPSPSLSLVHAQAIPRVSFPRGFGTRRIQHLGMLWRRFGGVVESLWGRCRLSQGSLWARLVGLGLAWGRARRPRPRQSHLLMSDFTHMMHDTRPWEAAYRHKHKHLPVHDTLLKAVGPKRLDMAELVFDDLGSLFRCVRPEVNIVFIGWHTFDKALRAPLRPPPPHARGSRTRPLKPPRACPRLVKLCCGLERPRVPHWHAASQIRFWLRLAGPERPSAAEDWAGWRSCMASWLQHCHTRFAGARTPMPRARDEGGAQVGQTSAILGLAKLWPNSLAPSLRYTFDEALAPLRPLASAQVLESCLRGV